MVQVPFEPLHRRDHRIRRVVLRSVRFSIRHGYAPIHQISGEPEPERLIDS
jgi:hypothetical protein